MSERLQIRSYEDRDSTKIGLADYIKKHVISIFLPFIGIGVGYGARKLIKIEPFQKWLNQAYVFPFYTPKNVRTQVEAGGGVIWRNAEAWGAKIGGFWGVYNLWRDKNKKQYGIDDVKQRIEQLKQLESADSYLTRENSELRQQISFLDRNPQATVTVERVHEGAVKDATQGRESTPL